MKGIVKMSKYIIDLDMLKDLLDMIPSISFNGEVQVSLNDVHKLINKFPKEKYVRECNKNLNNSLMDDIKSGRGLKPLPKKHKY